MARALAAPTIFVALAALSFWHDLWPAALPVLAFSYSADMVSTARFGVDRILRSESNPLAAALVKRFGLRRGFVVHGAIYWAVVLCAPFMSGDPARIAGTLWFAVAAMHIYSAARNTALWNKPERDRGRSGAGR